MKYTKKLLVALAVLTGLMACEGDKNTSIEIYYYGRTHLFATFEVPVKIYEGKKLVLDMVLYSLDSTLETGKYVICPKGTTGYLSGGSECVNKTYSHSRSFFNDSPIISGEIDVQKNDGVYSFNVNLKNLKRESISKTYEAQITNKTYGNSKSRYQGFFNTCWVNLDLEDTTDYQSTIMILETGDYFNIYGRNIVIIFYSGKNNDPAGEYNLKDNNAIVWAYHREIRPDLTKPSITKITTGSFSVINKGENIKSATGQTNVPVTVNIDVITEDGEKIQGSFINGDYFGNYRPNQ